MVCRRDWSHEHVIVLDRSIEIRLIRRRALRHVCQLRAVGHERVERRPAAARQLAVTLGGGEHAALGMTSGTPAELSNLGIFSIGHRVAMCHVVWTIEESSEVLD